MDMQFRAPGFPANQVSSIVQVLPAANRFHCQPEENTLNALDTLLLLDIVRHPFIFVEHERTGCATSLVASAGFGGRRTGYGGMLAFVTKETRLMRRLISGVLTSGLLALG